MIIFWVFNVFFYRANSREMTGQRQEMTCSKGRLWILEGASVPDASSKVFKGNLTEALKVKNQNTAALFSCRNVGGNLVRGLGMWLCSGLCLRHMDLLQFHILVT